MMRPALTKTLADRVRRLLNEIDVKLSTTKDMFDFQDWRRQVVDELCECRSALNAWSEKGKKRRTK